MRALKVGYMLMLSFFLMLCLVATTFGFFPPPEGPKAPEYPSGSGSGNYSQYETQMSRYKEEVKTFAKDQGVPYVRNVIVVWIFALMAFCLLGLLFMRKGVEIVGAGYSLTGLLTIVYGPIALFTSFPFALIAASGSRVDSMSVSFEPVFQGMALVSLVGALVLTAAGLKVFGERTDTVKVRVARE